ncbi:MAG: YceI family protein [Deltaproteobacteria bacterium]|nr:YceI family protein [Deltaproteobacteria bacterium]
MRRSVLAAVGIVALGLPALGRASTWEIDSAHTSVQFAVRHLMVSTVRGTMGKVSGVAKTNDADVNKSSVEASIDVGGISTREAKRDEHLKGADFFEVAKYPAITFKSKQITAAGTDKFKITGDLTIRGVTKEVVLDVEGSPKPFKDPFGNVKLGGLARTTINRQDFGVSWSKLLDSGGLAVGNDVEITIDIELIQKADDAAASR